MIRLLPILAIAAVAGCQEQPKRPLTPEGLVDFNECLLGITPVPISGWQNEVPRRCWLYAETQDMKRALKP
jgi:hypothetical protein